MKCNCVRALVSLVCIHLCAISGARHVDFEPSNKAKNLEEHLQVGDWLSLSTGLISQYGLDYRNTLRECERYKEPGHEDELDALVEQRTAYLLTAPTLTQSPPELSESDNDVTEECSMLYGTRDVEEDKATSGESEDSRIINDGFAPVGCYFDQITKRRLICNDYQMREIPRLPTALDRLYLTGTKISGVSRADFGDISIGNIQMVQNGISDLAPGAFSNVKNIFTLEIMDSLLTHLSFDICIGLTELISLHLDGNRISLKSYENCPIKTDVADIPTALPSLKFLSLKRNPLQIIPEQLWASLRETNLTMLDMSYCVLESIHPESFKFLKSLKTLYLNGNPRLMPKLASAFKGLRTTPLAVLQLRDNSLHRFPTDAISNVAENLETLDLSSNPISYLSNSDLPPNLTKLKILTLSNCNMIDIQDGALDLMPNLVQLWLNGNFLTKVPQMTNLTKLTHLYLNDNTLLPNAKEDENGGVQRRFIITDTDFANLPSLRELYLSNTKVKKFSKHAFSKLVKLDTLSMHNTELEGIEDQTFTGLESLKWLGLNNNPQLTSISPLTSFTFYGLHNLQYLYMANCRINFRKLPTDYEPPTEQSWKPDEVRPFLYLLDLRKLILSNNSIVYIYPQLFETNLNITELHLDGNDLQSWIKPILPTNYAKNRALNAGENLTAGLFETKFVISFNKFIFITEAMLEDIISFQPHQVDLSSNVFMCDKQACKARDLIIDDDNDAEIFAYRVTWVKMESYRCLNPTSDDLVPLVNVTDETCISFGKNVQPVDEPPPGESSHNWTTITIVSTVSFACVIAIVAVGYKQRDQIRYLLFRAQLNISVPRKAKTSLGDLIQYDYDIFISYHNEDRSFIQDKFLPEVEDPSFRRVGTDSDGIKSPGFRVCLHERDFEAGMPITENILDAVDRSKKVVIVVSKKYLESQWCTFEMNLAYHRLVESRRKSFVVIILEVIPPNLRTKVLNYLMRTKTYLEWPGVNGSQQDLQRFWTRLRTSFLATE